MKSDNVQRIPLYCSGKRAYDKKGAITAANKRYEEDRVVLRIYPCRGHWHLTSQVRGTRESYKQLKSKIGVKARYNIEVVGDRYLSDR